MPTSINSISGFKENHAKYLHLTDVSTSGTGFYKFLVQVQGLDSTNKENSYKELGTALNVYVYSVDGLIFCSKKFVEDVVPQSEYKRNYEEAIGDMSFQYERGVLESQKLFDRLRTHIVESVDAPNKKLVIDGITAYLEISKYSDVFNTISGALTVKNVQLVSGSTKTEVTFNESLGSITPSDSIYQIISIEDHFISIDSDSTVSGDFTRKIVNDFQDSIDAVANDENAKDNLIPIIQNSGSLLLIRARNYVSKYNTAAEEYEHPDDRPLYWARVQMEVRLKNHPFLMESTEDHDELLLLFEEATRGYTSVDFSGAPAGSKKVLLTGFDPFLLNPRYSGMNPLQSNPSGAASLALHGQVLEESGNHLFIQTMVIPTKYQDFDGYTDNQRKIPTPGTGIIENYIKPFIVSDSVDVIITMSQALQGQFHIDRFATINRGGTIDNMGHRRKPNSDSIIDLFNLKRPWIETTLPKALVMTGGASQPANNSVLNN